MFICLLDKYIIKLTTRTDLPPKPLCYISDFTQLYLYAVSLSLHDVLLQRQYTPLLKAAEAGQTEVVKILINTGADSEARNDVS